jgi:hypothetical protein
MRRLKLGTTGIAMALLLMVPRAASAGMGEAVDFIIGLTGPQMVGVPMACEVILGEGDRKGDAACYLAGIRVPWPRFMEDDLFWQDRNYWVSFGGGVYASTGKNSDMRNFNAYDVWMLAIEPMVNYRTFKNESQNFVVEHGVGPSLLFLFGNGIDGRDFEAFAKGGIKVRPVALTWRNLKGFLDLGVAYNLRIFPQPFTAPEFGGDALTNRHEGREYAQGFSVTVGF